jgi:hypothetical protein
LQRHLNAFDIVGPNGKDILVGYLVSKFGRPFVEGKYSASQVESALRAIIGEGASILVEEIQTNYRLC